MSNVAHTVGARPRPLALVEARGVFDKGSHRPLIVAAEDEETGENAEWVLKLQHNNHVNEGSPKLSVVRELAGAEMCALLGVRSPAIGLLRVPTDAEAVAVDDRVGELLRMNCGEILFCSRLVPDATDWPRGAEFGAEARAALKAGALALLYLDVFLLHDDRTVDRPNALLANGELWAIDHGNLVARLQSDSGVHGHVALRVVTTVLRDHFCLHGIDRALVRSFVGTLGDIAARAASIPDEAIDAAYATWPEELDMEKGISDIPVRTLMRDFLLRRRNVASQLVDVMRDFCRDLP